MTDATMRNRYTKDELFGSQSSFTNMSKAEREYFIKIIREEIRRRSDTSHYEQIRDIVPIENWIDSAYFVGPDANSIYPYWKDFIIDIFRNSRKPEEKINQVLLSGCFTGDTKVSLLSGEEKTFKELVEDYGTDKYFWVYSVDADGNIVAGHAHNAHKTKSVNKLIEITLDNGERVRCTLDHKFLLKDGRYCEAKDLKVGTSLMPLHKNRKVKSICIINADEGIDVYDIEVDEYHNFALSCGVFVHNSIGTGKSCLCYDTLIPTTIGVKTVEELYNLYQKGIRFKVLAESGIKDCIDVYNNEIDDTYKITMKSNKTVICTENHKFRVIRDGEIEWVKTKDIQKNDVFVMTRKQVPFGTKEIDLDEAYTLGYCSGDGYIVYNRYKGKKTKPCGIDLGYSSSLIEVENRIKNAWLSWFGKITLHEVRKEKTSNDRYIMIRNYNTKFVDELVKEGFGTNSEDKGVPQRILEGTREVVANYIRGLMDSDGTVDKDGKIDIILKSKKLRDTLGFLLSMFGINYTLKEKESYIKGKSYGIYYRLDIVNSDSYVKYHDYIGFDERYKKERLDRYYQRIIYGECTKNDRMNVPYGVKVLRELDNKEHLVLGRDYRKLRGFRINDNVGLSVLRRIYKINPKWVEQSEYLNYLCNNDVFFDYVDKIEYAGKKQTYDLTIDSDHSYCFNGFISHNTIAEIIMLRKLYELSCFHNINAMFHLMSKTNIMFLYFSVNMRQAERTGFGEFRAFVDNSPYFKENFRRRERLNSLLIFPEGLTFAYGSNSSDSIGMSVICSMLDEANFTGGNGDNMSGNTDKALELYAGIINRANSRFIMDGGVNHSLNILVSSATHENSASAQVIRKSVNDKHTVVAAPSQWEVKPDKFSKQFFFVMKGNSYLEPSIVKSVDDVNNFRLSVGLPKEKYMDGDSDVKDIEKEINKLPPHMQTSFLKVPVDLKSGFEANIIRSLQDLGGISTSVQGKLFTSPVVYNNCIDKELHHPFIQNELIISTGDNVEIKDYLRDDFRLKYKDRPRFIHIDQSFRTDSTGISCVYVGDIKEEDGIKKPIFYTDFMLRINPPKPPKKIAIYKVRNFVIFLANVIGMKIGKVTYDIFNSEESRQILEEMGFNVGYQSVDRSDKAYLDLVEIMYEGRLKIYDYPILRHELFNLIHDRARRKVDHPAHVYDSDYNGKGSTVGSKDTSDSLCLAYNTEIELDNNEKITIENLYDKWINNEYRDRYVYAYDTDRRVQKKVKIESVIRKKIIPTQLIKIIFNNGEYIRVTDNHLLLMGDGTYKKAKDIKLLDKLKAFTTYSIDSKKDTLSVLCIKYENNSNYVYDISLNEIHNFGVSCGIYVHNCGAVENALSFKIADETNARSTIGDFIIANSTYGGLIEPSPKTVEELVDRQIDDMIDEMEMNGVSEGYLKGF